MNIKLCGVFLTIMAFSAPTNAQVLGNGDDFGLEDEIEVIDDSAANIPEKIVDTAQEATETAAKKGKEVVNSLSDGIETAGKEISETVADSHDNSAKKAEEVVAGEAPSAAEDAQSISYYIKNLNLSVEQLDMAQHISEDGRLKQEQLLKSIYLLRKQARELESKSLADFEAILTPEQDEKFKKLKDAYEAERAAHDNLSKIVEEMNVEAKDAED